MNEERTTKIEYISTNVMKSMAILFVIVMHSLQRNSMLDYNSFSRSMGFTFWVEQGVSLFVIISGYHFAMSIEKLENELVWYRKDVFLRKLSHILPAYMVAFVLYTVYVVVIKGGNIGFHTILTFFKGGVGPGGYYTLIILELIAFFPVLYYIVKKFPVIGTMTLINMNILYEYAVTKGVISSSFNRLCFIRLLSGVVLGILLYRYMNELKKTVIPHIIFLVGLIFLFYYRFGDYKPQLVSGWICNSFMSMAYSFGIVYFVVSREEFLKRLKKKYYIKQLLEVVEYIGKASYHIISC